MDVKLVPYDAEFLGLSWEWLNEPEIKAMTRTPDFAKDEQEAWFNSLPHRTGYLIWGITVDGLRSGACGLKNFTAEECEFWSYLGIKPLWGKGIGKILMALLEDEAKARGARAIWLTVVEGNARACALYASMGYREVSRSGDLIKMRRELS